MWKLADFPDTNIDIDTDMDTDMDKDKDTDCKGKAVLFCLL